MCLAPPLELGTVVKDREALRAAFDDVCAWDFERLVPTHGDIIEDDPKEILRALTERFRD